MKISPATVAAMLGTRTGLTVGDIALAFGVNDPVGRNRVTDALKLLADAGHARHDGGHTSRRKWYATSDVAKRVRAAKAPGPRKPAPVVATPTEPETVAQWMRRTKQKPQKVGPLDAAQPLRYDHSDTSVPVAQRRRLA